MKINACDINNKNIKTHCALYRKYKNNTRCDLSILGLIAFLIRRRSLVLLSVRDDTWESNVSWSYVVSWQRRQ